MVENKACCSCHTELNYDADFTKMCYAIPRNLKHCFGALQKLVYRYWFYRIAIFSWCCRKFLFHVYVASIVSVPGNDVSALAAVPAAVYSFVRCTKPVPQIQVNFSLI